MCTYYLLRVEKMVNFEANLPRGRYYILWENCQHCIYSIVGFGFSPSFAACLSHPEFRFVSFMLLCWRALCGSWFVLTLSSFVIALVTTGSTEKSLFFDPP